MLNNILKLSSKRDAVDQYLWWGFLALAVSILFSIAIAQMVVGALAILWVIKIIHSSGFVYRRTPIDLAYFGFVASRILSIIFSINVALSLGGFAREIPFYILFVIVAQLSFLSEKDQLKKLLWVLIAAGTIAALYGSAKVIFHIEPRASSTTGGYITLGMLLTIILAVTLGLGRNKIIFPSRLIWGIVIFAMGIGILLTLNRSHWIVVALIFFIVGLKQERRVLGLSALFAILAVVFVPQLHDRFIQLIQFTRYASDRDVIWQGAFKIFFDRPIVGFGFGTFEEIFPLFASVTDKLISSWHCDYLQVYMEGGIIGLGALLWLWISVFRTGFMIIKRKEIDPFYKNLAYSIMLGMLAFAVSGIWGGFVTGLLGTLLFELLLGILALIALNPLDGRA